VIVKGYLDVAAFKAPFQYAFDDGTYSAMTTAQVASLIEGRIKEQLTDWIFANCKAFVELEFDT
jgi:hypothetical protein